MIKIIFASVLLLAVILGGISLTYNMWLEKYFSVRESVEFELGDKKFSYEYKERMRGVEWYLYIDDNLVCKFPRFEEYTEKEMKKHLENKELIRIIYDNGGVCVYAIPLLEYEKSYQIIYSVSQNKFYCWNDDVEYAHDNIAKERLEKLYQYVSKDELKKVSEESWE